ncbi:MAG: DUF4835 family protein [Chitinophagales bacterium]
MKQFLSIVAILLIGNYTTLQAQEILSQVIVQAPNVQNVDKKVFETLQVDLQEFVNGRKWGSDEFSFSERVETTFILTVSSKEGSQTNFTGSLTIQSSRPVYQSSYNTVVMNQQDGQVEFEYAQYDQLNYNDASYQGELTSLFAYYVYLVLAMDYDTFSPEGGSPFLLKAQTVVNNAQSSRAKGWKAFDGPRNRYQLVNNLLNNKAKPLRQCLYQYHRLGLDNMYKKADQGRKEIANALKLVEKTNKDLPNSVVVDMFTTAKADEVISIFANSQVPPTDKIKAYNSMVRIDPVNAQKYSAINQLPGGPKSAFPSAPPQSRSRNGGK